MFIFHVAVFLQGWFPQDPQGCQWTMGRSCWSTLLFRALRARTGKLMSLRNFLTTWLVLTDASGTIQNSGSLPWVHIGISWELSHSHGSWTDWLEGFGMGNLKSSPKPEDHWTEREPLRAPCSVGKSHEEERFPSPRYTSLPRAAPPEPLAHFTGSLLALQLHFGKSASEHKT